MCVHRLSLPNAKVPGIKCRQWILFSLPPPLLFTSLLFFLFPFSSTLLVVAVFVVDDELPGLKLIPFPSSSCTHSHPLAPALWPKAYEMKLKEGSDRVLAFSGELLQWNSALSCQLLATVRNNHCYRASPFHSVGNEMRKEKWVKKKKIPFFALYIPPFI